MLKTEKDYNGGHYVEPKKQKEEVAEEKELTEEEKMAAMKKAEDEAIQAII